MIDQNDEERNVSVREWTKASLRIISTRISSREIAEILATEATYADTKGDPVNLQRPDGARRVDSLWRLESPLPKSEPVEAHLDVLLRIFEEKKDTFEQLSADCTFDIMVGYYRDDWQGGFSLEKGLIRRLADASLDLHFNLYLPYAKE